MDESGVTRHYLSVKEDITLRKQQEEQLLRQAHFDDLTGLPNRFLSLDDFGTGYSSLSYLRSYPFDVLKIDRSFVGDITVDPSDQALINATIAMAHGLNLKVVAEGVETKEQLSYLKKQGCDTAQGYFFAKPMPGDDLLKWVMKRDEEA